MLHSSPPIAIIRNYHKGKPNVVERTLLLRFLMTEVSLLSLLKVTLPRKLQLSESFLLLPFLYPVGFFFFLQSLEIEIHAFIRTINLVYPWQAFIMSKRHFICIWRFSEEKENLSFHLVLICILKAIFDTQNVSLYMSETIIGQHISHNFTLLPPGEWSNILNSL